MSVVGSRVPGPVSSWRSRVPPDGEGMRHGLLRLRRMALEDLEDVEDMEGMRDFSPRSLWRLPKIEVTPKWRWFIMENPTKMDDLEVPLFQETSTSSLSLRNHR